MKKSLLFSMLTVCVLMYLIGCIIHPVFQHHGFWMDINKVSKAELGAIQVSIVLACLVVTGFLATLVFASIGNGKPIYYRSMPRGVKHHIVHRVDSIDGTMTIVTVQNKCGDRPTLVFFDFELAKGMDHFVVVPEPQRQLHSEISPQTQVIGV